MAADPDKLKVSELRAVLAARGLEEHGKKAQLVERLKQAMASEEDSKTNDSDDSDKEDQDKGDNGEKENEEEIKEAEEDSEDGEDGDLKTLNNEEPLKDAGIFEDRQFVSKKPEGISFELHTPTPKKPQPKEKPKLEEKPKVAKLLINRVKKLVFFSSCFETNLPGWHAWAEASWCGVIFRRWWGGRGGGAAAELRL